MAYEAPTLNATGLVIHSYEDIRDYLINRAKEIYGEDIYLAEDSQDYQWLSTFSLLMYDVCQCLIMDYNSHNPMYATGEALDRVASYCGIARKTGTASSVVLTCTGVPNTVVVYGSAKDNNGYIWQLEREFTIGENGEVDVVASCLEDGPVQAPIGTISTSNSPTSGWVSVTNKYPATVGSETESDSVLRARLGYAIAKPSVTILDGLIASLQNLDNVLKLKIYENDTSDYKFTVIPPHCIAVIVEGGDSVEIAETIYHKKGLGVSTYGNATETLQISNSNTIDIKYSRPEHINANMVVNIVSLEGSVDSISETIKTNIVDTLNEMEIGQKLFSSSLFSPVLNAITDISKPTFYVTSITVNGGTSLDSGLFGLITTDKSLITVNVSAESGV